MDTIEDELEGGLYMLDNTSTFIVAGDWHGNLHYALKALNYAQEKETKVIVHVGDFGFEPQSYYLDSLNKFALKSGIHILVVDGNHENHDWLNSKPISIDGTKHIKDRIWHLPRGFRWEWMGVQFVALGGAYSVDRKSGIPYIDWFPTEVISIPDAYKTIEGGVADIMITHDAPSNVDIPLSNDGWIPTNALEQSHKHREWLGEIVDNVQPKHLFHGHYHIKYDSIRENSNGSQTIVHGLDKDESSFEKNMMIINLDNFLS